MIPFLKRHFLVAGLVAALAPLTILLAFQYRWLQDLRIKSAIAHEAVLKTYLETIVSSIHYFYEVGAQRSLSLPASIFTEGRMQDAATHFYRQPMKGARRLFVLSFVGKDARKLLFYDPSMSEMDWPSSTEEAQAVYVACAPWQALSDSGAPREPGGFAVDERDRNYRLILNPILDESSRIVGVVGAILDPAYLASVILPMAVQRATPEFFPDEDPAEFKVMLRRRDEETPGAIARVHEVTRALTYVFTDHRISLITKDVAAARWAQAHVAYNMALSVMLGLVLVGGMAIALRTAAREMHLSRMKGDFVSNVSHELRTPLASIRVFGEFLRMGRAATPEKVREYGDYIETESRRLTSLVDNILDFSRIESGRKTYDLKPLDVREIVAETIRTYDVRLRHDGFRIEYEAQNGNFPPVLGDPGALAQAVGNLLDNAVKYSGESRDVRVRVAAMGRDVTIAVSDSGIGIARDEQARIFERFHRVGTGLVHDVKGSGLGLAIVSHIARAHQGSVSVSSEMGQGSTFTLSLPAAGGGG